MNLCPRFHKAFKYSTRFHTLVSLFRKAKNKILKPKQVAEPPLPAQAFIEQEMNKLKAQGIIKFDLAEDDYWYNNPDEFWAEFRHTGEVLVPTDFEKWLIGQEPLKEELYLNLEEWVRKRKDVVEMRKKPGSSKDEMRKFLKERPGPYLLIIGEPGTGKSLLIKIAKAKLRQLYKDNGLELQDVLLIKNPFDPDRPKVKYVKEGMGRAIVKAAGVVVSIEGIKSKIVKGFLGFLVFIGILIISTAVFIMMYVNITNSPDLGWFQGTGAWLQWMLGGMLLIVFPLMLMFWMGGTMPGQKTKQGGGHLENMPALVVDNFDPEMSVDFTSSDTSAALGSIKHDPYQSGGLGTPVHHRATAGQFHRADGKILYSDEILNNLQNERLVTEILTVLEDGAYPIRGRAWFGAEGNASLSGETDTPVDANVFWIAAGNLNALEALNKYPMLRDRFYYGNIVMADDECDDTPINRIKVAQFLADECFRFKVPPVCKEGVKVIINHMQRRASSAKKLKLQMRGYIQDIKKGGQLVWKNTLGHVECPCGVTGQVQHAEHILKSINTYAKPIDMQRMDRFIERRKPYTLINVKGFRTGMVNGLVVHTDHEGKPTSGNVASVTAWMKKLSGNKDDRVDNFVVTGATQDTKDTWIANSIMTVRTTIYRLYGIDLKKDYYVHISFLQSDPKGMDGPSAGITMTLALMSLLGDPRLPVSEGSERAQVPMNLAYPVTGTVENLGPIGLDNQTDPDVKVGPIGGVFEKVHGAMNNGAKGVIIPEENFDNSYFDSLAFKNMDIKHASTVLEYFDLLRKPEGRK